jgi:DNA polymerase-3 subunit gamma/tau
MNIHELDAASNNSVDDIRALVDQVRFAPQAGKYKVYIIDEVHMLSSSAFNAFLKTLEEPPSYAKFILATTEKHKILPTILSRCQIFDFKRITLQDTVDHLAGIANKEGIKADEAALQLISQKSEGCMRDALSILDKIVSFTNGEVNYENTIEHLNILDADYYFKLMDCMLNQDLAGAMLLYDDINKKGFEGDMVLNGFAEFVRNLLISKDERVAVLLEVVESFKKRYIETAKRTEAGFLVSALNILNEAEIGFRAARNKRLHVELAIIKLCYLGQALQLTATDSGVEAAKVAGKSRTLAFKSIAPIAVKQVTSKQITTTTAPPPPKSETKASAESAPKLVIEEPKVPKATIASEPKLVAAAAPPPPPKANGKISSLDTIRQQISAANANKVVIDQPLELESLKAGWAKFIQLLKDSKNSARQSFELAELIIKDEKTFEATASNNINQRFLEFERGKACEFLQKELSNRQLQFNIVLVDAPKDETPSDLPLTAKEQYLRLIEQFPLVQELRDRLRLELDY